MEQPRGKYYIISVATSKPPDHRQGLYLSVLLNSTPLSSVLWCWTSLFQGLSGPHHCRSSRNFQSMLSGYTYSWIHCPTPASEGLRRAKPGTDSTEISSQNTPWSLSWIVPCCSVPFVCTVERPPPMLVLKRAAFELGGLRPSLSLWCHTSATGTTTIRLTRPTEMNQTPTPTSDHPCPYTASCKRFMDWHPPPAVIRPSIKPWG